MNNTFFSILFFFIALFPLLASILNWDFFFKMSKSKFLVSILGRNGTRVFYGALGLVLMGVSIAGMFGYVNLAIDF